MSGSAATLAADAVLPYWQNANGRVTGIDACEVVGSAAPAPADAAITKGRDDAMGGTFELTKGRSGKFHFNLLAANKRVILTSEAYNSKAAALAGIASVRKNAAVRERFERRTAKNGKAFYVLLARNGEVIGQSQMYAHPTSCYPGIYSVMDNAATAALLDTTRT
jgi:hypothetical protein